MEIGMKQHFSFAPDILTRLGEELVPKPEQAIVELVRNSYDADALKCDVELKQIEKKGGTIIIRDDGVGMDLDSIINGWFVIGSSRKKNKQRTQKYDRLQVGDKGIGRLAALRLGTKVIVKTRPEREKGVEYSLEINWEKFDEKKLVENIEIPIKKEKTNKSHGTDIFVQKLYTKLTKRDIDRLSRELLLLSDPFQYKEGFKANLKAPEFKELEKKVKIGYFKDAEYHLEAKINENGQSEVNLLDWKGQVISKKNHKEITNKEKYDTVPVKFELWVFLLSPKQKSFSIRDSTITEIRNWLSDFGGVHLYHRGLRVRPYGDPGHDWLDMNLSRARSPEERPSTNTTIGRVIVEDEEGKIIQKTDRIGFIENDAFSELRDFCINALDWMAKTRLEEAEKRRQKKREERPKAVKSAEKNIDEALKSLPPKDKNKVEKTFKHYKLTVDHNIKSLKEDLQLYRSLATTGITAATFAHESSRPITLIEKSAKTLKRRIKRFSNGTIDTLLSEPIEKLIKLSKSIESFISLPVHLLKRDKRRSPQVVDIQKIINELNNLFQPFFNEAKIDVVINKHEKKVSIIGSIALIEAIITNFFTNSINAFSNQNNSNEERKIEIIVETTEEYVILRFLDNAGGIKDIDIKDIWLPGKTTISGGTGFGLTIVRDSVQDLGGSIEVIPISELGGAEFIVTLPLAN
jgi:nitrogen-specific signal transduction histidine kinase